jgi:hypothetical protein
VAPRDSTTQLPVIAHHQSNHRPASIAAEHARDPCTRLHHRYFAFPIETARGVQVVEKAQDFVELAKKAANSWPDIKPWLNITDIQALLKKVRGRKAAGFAEGCSCWCQVCFLRA